MQQQQQQRKTTQPKYDNSLQVELESKIEDIEDLNLYKTLPRKVAMIIEPTPFTHISGYSNRFRETLKYLKQAGDDVIIIVPDNSADAPKEIYGFPIFTIRGFRFFLYPKITLSFGLFSGMFSTLRRFRPDIVHASTPGFISFAVLFYVWLLRIPLVLSYHTHLPVYARTYGLALLERFSWRLISLVHNRADLSITVSPQLCQELADHGVRRIDCWRKAVDTETFHPRFRSEAMRIRLTDGHPDCVLLVYVGRLGAEKNLTLLKTLVERLPNVRLALIGDGPFAKYLRKYFAGTRTHFTGQLRGKELSEAFASGDIFVMPSESETMGFVVMEAMASGLAVVGVAAGGIPHLIQHQVTGYLYAPGDVDQMTQLVKYLVDHPWIRKEMASKARKETERWDWYSATAILRNVQYTRAIENFQQKTTIWRSMVQKILFWWRK
jgi:sulfoquinovosyltransferase